MAFFTGSRCSVSFGREGLFTMAGGELELLTAVLSHAIGEAAQELGLK